MEEMDKKHASQIVKPGVVTNKITVPNVKITKVASTIILVVSVMEVVLRRMKLNTSVATINPIDPANIKHEMTIFMVLLSTKFSSPLFHKAYPAVQNADTL